VDVSFVGLGKRVERILKPAGYRLSGFDPGFLFVTDRATTPYDHSLDMSVVVAQLLVNAVKNAKSRKM